MKNIWPNLPLSSFLVPRSTIIVFLLALTLRLLVWRWREFYPLGGDEREYLGQALTLLQQHRYVELRLMRPPIYTVFLAGCILLFDSLVQNLRLVQAIISATTVLPIALLTREIRDWRLELQYKGDAAPTFNLQSSIFNLQSSILVACLLLALSYTLAANATELLSETLFLFGLTTLFWLLVRTGRLGAAGQPAAQAWAAAAGLSLGLLCLTRSVALPLLPLGGLWLALQRTENREPRTENQGAGYAWFSVLGSRFSLLFLLCALLVILPWTARNYLTYGGLIIIDTTGAENLWLDNDPVGRDAVKAQLYDLGEQRVLRQQISTQRGLAAITADLGRFAAKAWSELFKFFALEYSDDMRARPQIWVPPAEVWARLLGDGLWLLVLLGGLIGLCQPSVSTESRIQNTESRRQRGFLPSAFRLLPSTPDPRWLFIPWTLYTLCTALIFHVELRYRLPLYPALIPYAALALTGSRQLAVWKARLARLPAATEGTPYRSAFWLLPSAFCLLLTLTHAPYPSLAWKLGWKHYHLARAEAALAGGDAVSAQAHGQSALAFDPERALARVALARAALLRGAPDEALAELDRAIGALPDHPYAHLLRGDLLRARGQADEARRELAFETASLEDLQRWSAERFSSPPPTLLDVGGGLDLGFVRGFYPAEQASWRWTGSEAWLRLQPTGGTLRLRLASGRPPGTPSPSVTVLLGNQALATLQVESDWQTYTLPVPQSSAALDIRLRTDTFTPRSHDRASPDGRLLGVMVDWAGDER